jgi:hypothetical protein
MRRSLARVLMGYGLLLIWAGRVIAGLAAVLCIVVGVANLIAGESPTNAALIFPGAPLVAGALNLLISGQGALWFKWGERVGWQAPPGTEKLDKITRRALSRDPELRALWEEE